MESAFTGNRNLLPGQSFCENRTFCRRQLSTGCLSQESQTPFVEDIQHFDWFLDCDDDDDDDDEYGCDDDDDGDDGDDDVMMMTMMMTYKTVSILKSSPWCWPSKLTNSSALNAVILMMLMIMMEMVMSPPPLEWPPPVLRDQNQSPSDVSMWTWWSWLWWCFGCSPRWGWIWWQFIMIRSEAWPSMVSPVLPVREDDPLEMISSNSNNMPIVLSSSRFVRTQVGTL